MVRHVFFARQEMGELVYAAALETLSLGIQERGRRLQAMTDKAVECGMGDKALSERVREVCSLFGSAEPSNLGPDGEAFLAGLLVSASEQSGGYLEAVQALTPRSGGPGDQVGFRVL